MQCNKAGCKQQFHVTCAQAMGLLCEEAGNYSDNVKYCGYCQEHFMKLVIYRLLRCKRSLPAGHRSNYDQHFCRIARGNSRDEFNCTAHCVQQLVRSYLFFILSDFGMPEYIRCCTAKICLLSYIFGISAKIYLTLTSNFPQIFVLPRVIFLQISFRLPAI